MTNKEIRAKALSHMEGKWGTMIALTVFKVTFIIGWILVEALLWLLFEHFGIEYSFTPAFLFTTHFGRFMMAIRLLIVFFVVNPESYILHRIFLDLYAGRNYSETRRYIQHNTRAIHPRATLSMALPMMLRIITLLPLLVSSYGIYYWAFRRRADALTTSGLFVFMVSIGFTLVWAGVFIHYSISLSMTKYIMLLNPRANVFDACDLSVRIMDGHHTQYIFFVLSFVRFLPLLLTFYPVFGIEPYYKMCKLAFAESIMGKYWQDKYPAMIQRWNKYAR
ncbi:MAG: hypothetical protein IKN17_11460 [Ruminococcus sp.]|nr:hypothetical protein [Ruminococcus sp.]